MKVSELNTKFNLSKALKANKRIFVKGIPNTSGRKGLIEEAIGKIQKNPETTMTKERISYKNYAHFGDQRHDCSYGMTPTHGSIVFAIGRVRGSRNGTVLGDDEIYLLECARDFEYIEDSDGKKLNFCNLLNKFESVLSRYNQVVEYLNKFEPTIHYNNNKIEE